MSKLKYKDSNGNWQPLAPSQKEFDDYKTSTNASLAERAHSIVNVTDKDYGAKGNANYFKTADSKFYVDAGFTTLANDDTSAFQTAVNIANQNKATLIIPYGNFYIQPDAQITIKVPVICLGTIKTLNSGTLNTFIIDRDNPMVTVQGSTITTVLNAGITSVPELSSYAGYGVVFESTEVLIVRNNTLPENYFKIEPNRVLAGGVLEKPLLYTYSSNSSITVKLLAPDKPINVQLNIELYGDIGAGRSVIQNLRSRCTMVFSIKNMSNTGQKIAVSNDYNIDATFENCTISGFEYSGYGYGVSSRPCYNIRYINCNMFSVRHGITGRHNRDVFINGGQYYSATDAALDDHWGCDMLVENATITGKYIVGYSGYGNVKLKNCKVIMLWAGLFYRRIDTPYHKGKYILEDVDIDYRYTGAFYLYRIDSVTFNHGITLENPDFVIKNVTIDRHNVNSGYLYGINHSTVVSGEVKQTYPKNILVENLSVINADLKMTVVELYFLDKKIDGNINVTLINLKSDRAVTTASVDSNTKFDVNFRMLSGNTITPDNRYSVNARNIENFAIKGDAFGFLKSLVENSKFIYLNSSSGSSAYAAGNAWDFTPNDVLSLVGCEINTPTVSKSEAIVNTEFINCIFTNFGLSALGGTNVSALTVNNIKSCTFNTNSIQSGGLNGRFYNRMFKSSVDNERTNGYRSNAGTPVAVLVPNYIGEEVLDTTNKLWYKSVGTTNADWKQIS